MEKTKLICETADILDRWGQGSLLAPDAGLEFANALHAHQTAKGPAIMNDISLMSVTEPLCFEQEAIRGAMLVKFIGKMLQGWLAGKAPVVCGAELANLLTPQAQIGAMYAASLMLDYAKGDVCAKEQKDD